MIHTFLGAIVHGKSWSHMRALRPSASRKTRKCLWYHTVSEWMESLRWYLCLFLQ